MPTPETRTRDWRVELFAALRRGDAEGIVRAFDGMRADLTNQIPDPAPTLPVGTLPDELRGLLLDHEIACRREVLRPCEITTRQAEETRARLGAVLLRLVADAERLDWLEAEAKTHDSLTLGFSRECRDWDEMSNKSVVWPATFWINDETDVFPPRASLRDAIDRAARPPGGPDDAR